MPALQPPYYLQLQCSILLTALAHLNWFQEPLKKCSYPRLAWVAWIGISSKCSSFHWKHLDVNDLLLYGSDGLLMQFWIDQPLSLYTCSNEQLCGWLTGPGEFVECNQNHLLEQEVTRHFSAFYNSFRILNMEHQHAEDNIAASRSYGFINYIDLK